MTLRKLLFWSHLVLGLACAAVLSVTAFTGAMLAVKPLVMSRVEADVHRVAEPAGAPRLAAYEWVLAVEEAAGAKVTGLSVAGDPAESPLLLVGRKQSWRVNPVTGAVAPAPDSAWRGFFDTMLTWHRWLGAPAAPRGAAESGAAAGPDWRERASTLVGVSAGVLVLLTVTGLVLWWPRSSNRAAWRFALLPALRRALVPDAGNWHRVAGFWLAAPILLTALTGVALAFPAVADAVARRPDSRTFAALDSGAGEVASADVDECLDTLRRAYPGAARYTLSLVAERGGRGSDSPGAAQGVVATVQRAAGDLLPVSVVLHPRTGALVRERAPESLSPRVWLRLAIRPWHEGAWGGVAGVIWALAATGGTLLLLLTGLVLSAHRFYRSRVRPAARVVNKIENQ